MAHRLTLEEVLNGVSEHDTRVELERILDEYPDDFQVAALCSAGCDVYPDRTCRHGHPALTMALGLC